MATKPKILRFTRGREASFDDAENTDIQKELKRAAKFFASGECVPESVWRCASGLLAEKSRALCFSSHQTYFSSMRETLRRYPFLRLGTTRYMEDKHFPDVEFIEEETADVNT